MCHGARNCKNAWFTHFAAVNLDLPHFLLQRSLHRKQARAEEFWPRSTLHRSFERFQTINLSFRLAVALCSTVIRYRGKGVLRDVGKALGLPESLTKTLSSQVWSRTEGVEAKHAESLNLNMADRRLRLAWVTTGRFLEAFGLASLRDLPEIERVQDEGAIEADALLDRAWDTGDSDLTDGESEFDKVEDLCPATATDDTD